MAECSSANKIYYADTYTYLVINFLEENVFRQQLKIECSCSCQDMQEQWRICGEGTQRGSEYSCSKASFFWRSYTWKIFQVLRLYLLMVSQSSITTVLKHRSCSLVTAKTE